jgi:hypothetical protein
MNEIKPRKKNGFFTRKPTTHKQIAPDNSLKAFTRNLYSIINKAIKDISIIAIR